MPETTAEPKKPISKETLRKAMTLDLDAAIYFLMALKENPDLLDQVCHKLHDRYTRGASLIDHMPSDDLTPGKNGTN